ncbi:response regulator [Geobacter sp.]|uniref:response regulator n=1 Tax=Geobacter sp. TaxID=46610 RepID=UPI00260EE5CF|nr:response regulator [Geobacter sp.]
MADTGPTYGDLLFVTDKDRCVGIETLLARCGVKVARAESGVQALSALDAEPWAVMVADAMLPDMDGVELTRAARAKRPGMFVILGSADPSEKLGDHAAMAGVAGIVHTPYEPDELLPLLCVVMQSRVWN